MAPQGIQKKLLITSSPCSHIGKEMGLRYIAQQVFLVLVRCPRRTLQIQKLARKIEPACRIECICTLIFSIVVDCEASERDA
jgi:hypothetical protein